ncbi:MAG: fumarylacetoacetate hydrolase family protein [Segetibacter sp.]|nr:fumarylacetoacetate hydrolase family protein [Segetibacter sp.]
MKIYKTISGIILEHEGSFFVADTNNWDEYINRDDLYVFLLRQIQNLKPVSESDWNLKKILAPIGSQEVWAAGVTYLRSKVARMEESEESGGATFYDKVYDAERPELFFKATPQRVVGTNDYVRIRKDSTWDVPEPELTLVITASGKIVGYTIGNDMSSRSIEGENPLYLPQAKVYEKCAGLGPCILVTENGIPSSATISMTIERNNKTMFEGSTNIDQMKRSHNELVSFLYRECAFPDGAYLMTGTCVVPENNFTLQSKDVITITIEHIGTLVNIVE